jgi:hypothetical protein
MKRYAPLYKLSVAENQESDGKTYTLAAPMPPAPLQPIKSQDSGNALMMNPANALILHQYPKIVAVHNKLTEASDWQTSSAALP